MNDLSMLPEFRCTKNVIGVDPQEQNGSYIRAVTPIEAAEKYFARFTSDKECTVQLWKEVDEKGRLTMAKYAGKIIDVFLRHNCVVGKSVAR